MAVARPPRTVPSGFPNGASRTSFSECEALHLEVLRNSAELSAKPRARAARRQAFERALNNGPGTAQPNPDGTVRTPSRPLPGVTAPSWSPKGGGEPEGNVLYGHAISRPPRPIQNGSGTTTPGASPVPVEQLRMLRHRDTCERGTPRRPVGIARRVPPRRFALRPGPIARRPVPGTTSRGAPAARQRPGEVPGGRARHLVTGVEGHIRRLTPAQRSPLASERPATKLRAQDRRTRRA